MFRKLPGQEEVLTRKQNWTTWAVALSVAIIVLVFSRTLWAAILAFVVVNAGVRLYVAIKYKHFFDPKDDVKRPDSKAEPK